jgi:hypothetical protein
MGKLRPDKLFEIDAFPLVLDEQILARGQSSDSHFEAFEEVSGPSRGGLPGNRLDNCEQILRAVIHFAHKKADMVFLALAFTDVSDKRDGTGGLARRIAQQRYMLMNPKGRSVLADITDDDFKGRYLSGIKTPFLQKIPLPIVWMYQCGAVEIAKLRFGVAKQRDVGRVEALEPAIYVRNGNPGARVFKNAAKPLFALAQYFIGIAALNEICGLPGVQIQPVKLTGGWPVYIAKVRRYHSQGCPIPAHKRSALYCTITRRYGNGPERSVVFLGLDILYDDPLSGMQGSSAG